jgi:hypothetical protein
MTQTSLRFKCTINRDDLELAEKLLAANGSESLVSRLVLPKPRMIKKVAISSDITLCSPYMNRRFGVTYHLRLPSRMLAFLFIALLVFDSEDGGDTFPKRRFIYGRHSAITQKIATFITTAVRTSHLAQVLLRNLNVPMRI